MAYLPDVAVMLIDGENLTFRYQHMLKSGCIPKSDVIHRENEFVWSPDLATDTDGSLRRITYFGTTKDANPRNCELWKEIAKTEYVGCAVNRRVYGRLIPYILKRRKKDGKDKILDIHLTIEALRIAFTKAADEITIVSGDSDYVAVVEEIRRLGPKTRVLSLSSGISDDLKLVADYYQCIDYRFFRDTTS